ncbi:MAG: metal ABC transporter permease, partial [Pseudomonadota bacterium]|nr:metal ABC transporter permease [Pseudomonadota bacterium]
MNPAWADLADRALQVLTFRGGFNANSVLLGTLLLGVAAGVVGTFIVLRGRALISDALSHATLPGIVLGFLVAAALGLGGRNLPLLLLGAALSGALGVWLVQLLTHHTRLTEDTAIGVVLSVSFGLGVALLSYAQTLSVGGQAGLKTFILGQAAAMSRAEALAMGALALAAVGLTLLFEKEFALLCFNPEFAQGLGWPVVRLDLLLSGLTVLVAITGLQTVGLVLVVALLILPPAAARLW